MAPRRPEHPADPVRSTPNHHVARSPIVLAIALVALAVALTHRADACVWDKQTAEAAAAMAPDVADLLAGRVVVPSEAYWEWRLDLPNKSPIDAARAFVQTRESAAALRTLNRLPDERIDADAIVLAAFAKMQWIHHQPASATWVRGTHSEAEAIRIAARFLPWDDLHVELTRRGAREAGVTLRLWEWLVPTPQADTNAPGLDWLLLPDTAKLGQGWRMWGANDKPLIPNVEAGQEPTYEQTHRAAADKLARLWIDDASSFDEVRATVIGALQRNEPRVMQGYNATGEVLFYALLGEWLAIEKLKPLAYRAYDRALDALDGLPAKPAATIDEWRPRLREELQRWMTEVKTSTRTDQKDFESAVIASERTAGGAFRAAYADYEETCISEARDALDAQSLAEWKASYLSVEAQQARQRQEEEQGPGTPATPWVIAGIAALLAIWLSLRKGGG